MARAKKTDRAEARRRARVVAAPAEGTDETTSAGSAAAPPDRAAQAAPARPGVTTAFREAYRPVHLRQDIRDIPWLVTRTPAIALPVGLVVVASIWFVLSAGSMAEIASSRYASLAGIAFSLLVAPPPIGSAFLAGILAPRMSYMAGLITGVAALIAFAIVVVVVPAGVETPLPNGLRESWALWALSIGPVSALLIGAFAGFYRRFLRQINPNSGRKSQPQSRGKGTAKATARR